MEKSNFIEDQIAFALKQAELGMSVEEVYRKIDINDATFYVWCKKYGSVVGPSKPRGLCLLTEENRKFRQIVAGLSLDKAMLLAVVAKSCEAFAAPRVGARVDAAFRMQPAQCCAFAEDVNRPS